MPKDELAQFLRETDDDYWGAAEEFGVEIKMIIDACYYHFRVEPAAIRARLGIEEE